MVCMGRQMLGFTLSIIGFLGTIIVCAMPMWKVTFFIDANNVTEQIIWEGLWMNYVMQSTGQMEYEIYHPQDAPEDLQAGRALVVIAIIVAAFGILSGIAGKKCTNCIEEKTTTTAGVIFICAGILVLIPVSWSANTIRSRNFYNSFVVSTQRRKLGAALYVGWGTAALLLLGGVLQCCSCPLKESPEYPVKHGGARSTATRRPYV